MEYRQVTRLALLIGAPGKNKNYLRGVSVDLENVQNFLLSPNGGTWHPHEIVSLPNACLSDVAYIIEAAYADYLFVYFSGHGYIDDYSNKRMLCLQDSDVEDLFLLNNSPRQLILVDACRNYVRPGISGIPGFAEEPLHFDGESAVRNLFNQLILQSPAGRIIVHGTQSGQYSNDSIFGGHFTQALLRIATRINAGNDYTTASISRLVSYVPSVLEEKGNSQIPDITYSTGNMNVPFAIGIPQRKYREILQTQLIQQQPQVNWGGIALTALGLILIGAAASD
jgi:hypothetical protein